MMRSIIGGGILAWLYISLGCSPASLSPRPLIPQFKQIGQLCLPQPRVYIYIFSFF